MAGADSHVEDLEPISASSFIVNDAYVQITTGYLGVSSTSYPVIKRRWFVFDKNGFNYYKSHTELETLLGMIDLTDAYIEAFHVKMDSVSEYSSFLRISTPTSMWTLTAESVEDLMQWHNVFYSCNLCGLSTVKVEDNTHKQDHIHPESLSVTHLSDRTEEYCALSGSLDCAELESNMNSEGSESGRDSASEIELMRSSYSAYVIHVKSFSPVLKRMRKWTIISFCLTIYLKIVFRFLC